MARYIDMDVLISELSASCMPIDDREISGLFDCDESIRDIIDAIPAADVRPERHAEWVDYKHNTSAIQCTACERVFESAIFGHTYCPHCGAIMDGKGSE